MRINLFYVIITALIIVVGVFIVRPRELPSRMVAGSEERPTPPPEEVLATATSPLPAPTNLNGTVTSSHHVVLSWSVTENSDVRRYRVVRNNLLIAEVTEARFADVYTIVGRQYGYYVQAIDDQGRFSFPSNFIIVDTSTALTSTPPSAPTPSTPTSSTNRTPAPSNTNIVPTPSPTTDEPEEETIPATTQPLITNTSPSPSVNHEITVTEQGVFTPQTITIRAGDSITFVYSSGEGDEVVLEFSPSISSTVKLDHEHTSKTVLFTTIGTYTYRRVDSSVETGTIIVTAP